MLADVITNLIWLILGGTVLGLIAFYFLVISKFKHKVRIKEICNNRMIITDAKAREHRDRDRNITWYVNKIKKHIPVPSNEVIEIDNKGKKLIEIYLTETGEVFFAKDSVKLKPIPEDILEEKDDDKKAKLKADWLKKNCDVSAYEPYTTDDRYFLIQQDKKAAALRKKTLAEQLPMIAGIMSTVIIVVMLMIFWGDIAEPALQGQELQRQTIQLQKETAEIMRELKQDIQIIKSEAKIEPREDGATPDVPPN